MAPKSFSQWLSKKFGKGDAETKVVIIKQGDTGPLQPPLLPRNRPYALTPSSSQEHLQQKSAPFFQRLPAELRQKILIYAFGRRTLHMDLQFERDLQKPEPGTPPYQTHLSRSKGVWQSTSSLIDPLSLDEWRWVGSVCHRISPGGNPYPPGTRLGDMPPCRDNCRNGRAYNCEKWPGEIPSKCQIGVMGWILSCRQAYFEGIHILYGTNTISVPKRCGIMVKNWPRLVPPQNLAMITSLEVSLDVKAAYQFISPAILLFQDKEGVLFVNFLKVHFPQLQNLHLSFGEDVVDCLDEDLDMILDAMDMFLLNTPSLRNVEVGLTSRLLNLLLDKKLLGEEGEDKEPRQSNKAVVEQIWRCLGDTRGFDLVSTNTSLYPKSPRSCPREAMGHGPGYWLLPGGEISLDHQRIRIF